MILVTGASGFLGSYIVSEARRLGKPVRGLVRKSSDISAINIEDEHLIYGDITDVDSLIKAMNGCDVVIHSAAIISESTPDEELSHKVNVEGTENVITACKKAGIKRLIHISAHSAKEDNPSVYARTKLEADKRLQASDLDWTIVKPAIIYGPATKGLFAKIKNIVNSLPIIPVLGSGTEQLRPVYVYDLTEAILKCVDDDISIGKIYDIGGAEVVTFNQFLQTILKSQGKKPKKLIHIPLWVCYLMARAFAQVLKNPPITVDNLDGLKKSKGFSIELAQKELSFSPLTMSEGLTRTFNLNGRKYATGNSPKKRIAIVGLGKMGIMHSSMINVIPNATVAALVDRDQNQGKSLQSMGINAPFFSDLEDAVKQVELDGVIICTPQFAHRPVAEIAINTGLHVLCEKPLAHTMQDSEFMINLVKNKPEIKHTIGYMMGYSPPVLKAKSILESGTLGKLQIATATCYLSQVFRPSSAWFYKPELSGGGLVINVTSHLFAVLHTLFGELQCDKASVKSVHSEKVEDEATATYYAPDGLKVDVKTSWSVRGYPLQYCSVTIQGENGSLHVDNDWVLVELKKSTNGFKRGVTNINLRELERAPFNLSPDYMGDAYYQQDREFVNTMADEKSSNFTWYDGFAVQKMIDQLYKKAGVDYSHV